MTWRLSDGTTVELGGNVDGDSYVAQWLRAELDTYPFVTLGTEPCEPTPLNVADAAQVNRWLDDAVDVLRRVQRRDIRVTARPDDIPPLPPDAPRPTSADVIC